MVSFAKDTLERVVRTFVAAFVGVLIPALAAGAADVHDVSTAKALAVSAVSAAIAAGVSAVLSLWAKSKPNTVTPASFVKIEPAGNLG